jgi:hypothetical protein
VFFWDLGIDAFLGLFLLGAERVDHAGMVASRVARSAENLLAGVDKALFDGEVLHGVGGDTRAASTVGSMFIAGVSFRVAVLAFGLALALLEFVAVHVALSAKSEGRDFVELLERDRGFGEEDGVGRGLCEVPGDGTIMVFEADGEVGKGKGLPSRSDPSCLVYGAALFESIKGRDVGGELILSDRDSSRTSGATVANEASEGEVTTRA